MTYRALSAGEQIDIQIAYEDCRAARDDLKIENLALKAKLAVAISVPCATLKKWQQVLQKKISCQPDVNDFELMVCESDMRYLLDQPNIATTPA